MRRIHGHLPTLIAGLVIAATALPGRADVSTDIPGAILVFPKVQSDPDRETILQVTNNTGERVFLRCFYIDGRTGREGGADWLVTDFQITLTRNQPTVWVAGQGLPAVPPDRPDDLYPGPVPPVSDGFRGSLRCIVVDESERPIGVNAISGEATLIDRESGTTLKYPGVSIRGFTANDGNNTLLLDQVEYGACPRMLLLNHFFDDAPDPVLDTPIQTELTIVPCSMDLEKSIPGEATLQFEVFNEFEQRLSTSLPIDCYEQTTLSAIDGASPALSIFNFALQGTLVGLSRIRPVIDSRTDTGHGVLIVAEERREGGSIVAPAHMHYVGGNLQTDVIILSEPF
jgi:hypothetical protein